MYANRTSFDSAMTAKNDTSDIVGLPEGALIQSNGGRRYVYFGYNFRSGRKRTQERDYIGVVDENNTFVPNLFYRTQHPVAHHRAPDRWKDERRREQAMQQAQEEQAERERYEALKQLSKQRYHDFDIPADGARSVGMTALFVALMYQTHLIQDVCRAVFDGDVKATINVINLAIHSLVCSEASYLARNDSKLMGFIGRGCLSSPRISEFFARHGSDLNLSHKISCARTARLGENALLALDGTRIDSYSKAIVAKVGKDKDGHYSRQINFAILVDTESGLPIGYRYYPGNIPDVSTLQDLHEIWNDANLKDKNATIVMDRGYINTNELVYLAEDGYRFLLGGKTCMTAIKSVIEEQNAEFFKVRNLIRGRNCYGLKSQSEAVADNGARCCLHEYVFRSPMRTTEQSEEFLAKLDQVEKRWLKGTQTESDIKSYSRFFIDPEPGKPLVRDLNEIDEESYLLGFFGMIGNVDKTPAEILDIYSRRNEVEVVFRLMFEHLISTTKVHSTAALEALLLIVFVGLSVISTLHVRMSKADTPEVVAAQKGFEPSKLGKHFSMVELTTCLNGILLCQNEDGAMRLLNVTEKDRALVKALGLAGLYDDPEALAKLFSPTYMAEVVAKEDAQQKVDQ